MTFFRSSRFWASFAMSGLLFGALMVWEAGLLAGVLPSLPRPPIGPAEAVFSAVIVLLLAFNIGLFSWRSRYGTCPVGTRRATGMAGAIGAVTLLCPVCLLIPLSVLGTGVTLTFLSPYLPLLRIISLILLLASVHMLWPSSPRPAKGKTARRR